MVNPIYRCVATRRQLEHVTTGDIFDTDFEQGRMTIGREEGAESRYALTGAFYPWYRLGNFRSSGDADRAWVEEGRCKPGSESLRMPLHQG
jgi:hypothetical protein